MHRKAIYSYSRLKTEGTLDSPGLPSRGILNFYVCSTPLRGVGGAEKERGGGDREQRARERERERAREREREREDSKRLRHTES